MWLKHSKISKRRAMISLDVFPLQVLGPRLSKFPCSLDCLNTGKPKPVKEPTLHEQFFPQLIFAWWTRGKQERVTYINISHLPAMGC